MNNSFPRLIDGMCATLRTEVLSRLDDEFARGQVYGVINLLNTFKVRADWSAGFLAEQVRAQEQAFEDAKGALAGCTLVPPGLPPAPGTPASVPELLARRDALNAAIGQWLAWLDEQDGQLDAVRAAAVLRALRAAMRSEVDIELRNAPRPLFAEMSSGRGD